MRRPLTFSICAVALALVPSVLYAQEAAAAQKPPALTFSTDAGLLLIQIKPDQTAAFEEVVAKLRAGADKTEDATVKAQLTNMKVYKAAEPMAGNALFVVVLDPVSKDANYDLFQFFQKTMTADELRAEATQEFFKRATGAFASGYNKLSLTPVK